LQYRRAFVPGASYFFTVITNQRENTFSNPKAVDLLRDAFRQVMEQRSFNISVMVVLPDHLHCIWTLPSKDCDYSTRWRLIKTFFSKRCAISPKEVVVDALSRRGDMAASLLGTSDRDEEDYLRHVECIHYNPVRHGYVRSPIEWACSGFLRYVERGQYPKEWGEGKLEFSREVVSRF